MCSKFLPASPEALQKIVNKDLPAEIEHRTDAVFPRDKAPIIINGEDCEPEVVLAEFSLYPEWAIQPLSYSTHNARLETITKLRTFKKAYRKSQFCLVPMQAFYEPYYPKGKNVWQSIHRKDNDIFTVPAIYEYNDSFDEPIYSFSLLTVDAQHNELMKRFHKPQAEKRAIMEIAPEHRDYFLVSNWKFIRRYTQDINHDNYTHKDKDPQHRIDSYTFDFFDDMSEALTTDNV